MRTVMIAMLAASACASVRTSDLDAWRGVRADEVRVHPLFSSLPKQSERLDDGGELWTFTNCAPGVTPRVCNPVGNALVCSGGAQYQACCNNQFLVRGSTVEWYRVSGQCRTDCSLRPASRPCS